MNFMHATRIKVLLVEDNPGDARLIQEMLSEAGASAFALEQAARHSTGLERLAAGDIDAVLLDLGLPDSSGMDTFSTVHAQAPDVPIVMLTGLDDAELAIKAVQEGAQDYLPKNKLDSELLVRTIRYAIERKKTETHIKHLNSVLKAIRGVNQLIVMEKDRDTLLQNACDTLAEARGYDAAWLGFLEDGETFATVKGSGLSEDVTRFREHVLGGDHPPCIRTALAQGEMVLVPDKTRECGDCFFKAACVGKEVAIIRVEHAGSLFGVLAVLLAPEVAVDKEEKGLLEEVAGDIALGLHDMELDEARKQAGELLRTAEEDWRNSFNSLDDVMLIIDRDYNIENINEVGLKLLGKSKEAVIGEKCYQVLSGADSPAEECPCRKSLETKKVESLDRYEERFGKYYSIQSSPIFDENGEVIKFVDLRRDITERKRIEETLRESEERFRALIESTSDWIWEVDENAVYTYASPKIKELLGYEPEEIIGKTPFDLMTPENVKRVAAEFGAITEAQKPFDRLENENLQKDGQKLVLETSGVPIFDTNGNFRGYHGIDRDITERKRAEEQIKASLKEKEILLREIHHRVKNNLQVVSSLLNLQARAAKDENTGAILRESRDRINTMALIHTKLYESGNLSEINMKGFVEGLIRQLFLGYQVPDTKIVPVVHVADCTLPISIAVPFGLVVNELLTNAFKHAFVNRAEGKIEVSLCASEQSISMTVRDDGVGLPEGFDINTTKTLGLHLVKILVEDQLQGKLEVVSDKDATFKVEFKREDNGVS